MIFPASRLPTFLRSAKFSFHAGVEIGDDRSRSILEHASNPVSSFTVTPILVVDAGTKMYIYMCMYKTVGGGAI